MARFVIRGRVRITGAQLEELVVAPNIKKARTIGENWARENDLVFQGVETEEENNLRKGLTPAE